ncbi:MAG TPA: hypothetical protein ENH85_13805 [Candidatus Scalindua sp.]|nr:hypothetical protein [Candidatus Scalindua sp.]
MNSHLTDDFIQCFQRLPERIKRKARKNYRLWKQDQFHPSLEFKKVHPNQQIYSVRIGVGWRALGVREEDNIIWFWIGSHSNYDKLLRQL